MAGVQYFSGLGLDTDNDGFADETSKDFCLLSAHVSYTLVKNLSLWVRGENLLAQRYEINYGYPMPRATFMGGINFAF
jgi:iron complex outermembrane receptor protein